MPETAEKPVVTREEAERRHADYKARIAGAVAKHAALRAKLEEVLNRDIPGEDVFDHEGQKLDRLMLDVTDTSCLIVRRPWVMLEGGGIPDFSDYKDWKSRVQILIAPDEARRDAYMLLFPGAEIIDYR